MNIVGDSEHFKQPYDQNDDYVSRADTKREITIYQELGKRLISLSKGQLEKLDLDELLFDNVLKAKTIKINTEAHRRQLQFIGKIMRNEDIDALQIALKNVLNQNHNESAKTNVADKTRNQLLAEGDIAIQSLLEQHPQLERQKLRQLVRQTHKELAKNPDVNESKTAKDFSFYLRNEINS